VYHVGFVNCGKPGAIFLKKVSATLSYSETQRQQCQQVQTCSSCRICYSTAVLTLLLVITFSKDYIFG